MSLAVKEQARTELRVLLEEELDTMTRAARAAHEAATHEEARAEGDKDTRSIELGYLAGAQAQRAAVIEMELARLGALALREFEADEPISVGAIVEVQLDDRIESCFLVPVGGGARLRVDGKDIRALATTSPLGAALLRAVAGDRVELETPGSVKEYEVLAVR